MNDRQPDLPAGDDEELDRLLGHAQLRPRPSAAATEAAFGALQAEWRELVIRRQRRLFSAFGVAAALVLGVAAGVWVLGNRQPVAVAGPIIAEIARIEGAEVTWRDENSPGQRVSPSVRTLTVGQRLSTGADSRVALAWHAGGSLRLDADSRLELVSTRSVRLVAGSVYFDSAATAAASAAEPASLTVQTPAGEFLHVGTQFMMTVEGETVVVSVREGEVRVTGDGFELTVTPGEQLSIDPTGVQSRRGITSSDDAWSWAAAIAPRQVLDDRTAHDILTWVARETGRRLDYASRDAETLMRNSVIRGLGERTPESTLAVLPLFTGLRYEIRADAIVLSSP